MLAICMDHIHHGRPWPHIVHLQVKTWYKPVQKHSHKTAVDSANCNEDVGSFKGRTIPVGAESHRRSVGLLCLDRQRVEDGLVCA